MVSIAQMSMALAGMAKDEQASGCDFWKGVNWGKKLAVVVVSK